MYLSVICLFSLLMDTVYGWNFGSCSNHQRLSHFDIFQFTGQWYGIAKSYSWLETNSDCVGLYFKYVSVGKLKMEMVVVSLETGSPSFYTGHVLTYDESYLPKIIIVLSQGESKYQNTYQVIDTDYSDFAILYSCVKFAPFLYSDVIWIISRERSFSDAISEKVAASLNKTGLDPNRLSSYNIRCNYGYEPIEKYE